MQNLVSQCTVGLPFIIFVLGFQPLPLYLLPSPVELMCSYHLHFHKIRSLGVLKTYLRSLDLCFRRSLFISSAILPYFYTITWFVSTALWHWNLCGFSSMWVLPSNLKNQLEYTLDRYFILPKVYHRTKQWWKETLSFLMSKWSHGKVLDQWDWHCISRFPIKVSRKLKFSWGHYIDGYSRFMIIIYNSIYNIRRSKPFIILF